MIWLRRAMLAISFLCFGPLAYAAARPVTPSPVYFPPEYHPVSQVILSEDLFAFSRYAHDLGKLITEAGAEVIILTAEQDPHFEPGDFTESMGTRFRTLALNHRFFWLRDFGPIPVISNSQLIFNDFGFTATEPDLDDLPLRMAPKLSAIHQPIAVELDGGNLLSDGKDCYLGLVAGLPIKSAERLQTEVEQATKQMGCERAIILREAPHVHIDMYVKLLPEDVALVGEFEGRQYFQWQKDLAFHLDGIAKQLAPFKTVKRIPMYSDWPEQFVTYTNAILVNGTAIVPSYGTSEDPLHAERIVRRAYEEAGYRVAFLPADDLIQYGGAFHCVSVQIPKILTK